MSTKNLGFSNIHENFWVYELYEINVRTTRAVGGNFQEKTEYGPMISFLLLQRKSPQKMNEEMLLYGEEYLPYETVKQWKKEYKCDYTNLHEDPKEGCPSTATEQVVRQN